MYINYQIIRDTAQIERDLNPPNEGFGPCYEYKGRITIKDGKLFGNLTVCGVEESGRPRRSHKPKIVSSNLTPAPNTYE